MRDKAAETGTFELALGFSGGIEDPVTGLVRFGVRDYEPATGRFTAKDPIGHEGGMNLFVYAGNNPVAQRDPSGMDEIDPSLLTLPTPGERLVGHFNKLVEWIKSEDGRDTIENIAEIPSENQAIKSVEMLDKGLSAVDFAEDAMAVYEAESQNISGPEQAVAWIQCGLGIIDDVQPIPLSPGELFEKALDALLPHARRVRDSGTGRIGEAAALEAQGMGPENRR